MCKEKIYKNRMECPYKDEPCPLHIHVNLEGIYLDKSEKEIREIKCQRLRCVCRS
jgi:hypothetical protein